MGRPRGRQTDRVTDELEEQPSREEEEGAEQSEQEHDDEDEDESPALQRIVEFYGAHPYFYNLRHEKYRNSKLKEAELAYNFPECVAKFLFNATCDTHNTNVYLSRWGKRTNDKGNKCGNRVTLVLS